MKKKVLFIAFSMCIAFVAIYFIWEANATQLGKPPKPSITTDGKKFAEVGYGSYCWSSKRKGVCIDTPTPTVLTKKMKPMVANGGDILHLNFEYIPNGFGVNDWTSGKAEKLSLNDNSFILPEQAGKYVYEVYANWKEGSSSFAFTIEVQTP